MFRQKETPIRIRRRFWIFVLLISDAAMMMLSFRLGYFLRFESKLLPFDPYVILPVSLLFYTRLVYLFIPLLLIIFFFYRLYDWDHLLGGSGEYTRVVSATTMGLFAVVIVSFMFKAPTLARAWLLLVWFFCCGLIVGARFLFRGIIYWQRKRGTASSRLLIVGANEEGKTIAEQILKSPTAGLKIVGFADDDLSLGEEVCSNPNGSCAARVIGRTSSLSKLIEDNKVESIVFASSAFPQQRITEMIQSLRGYALDIYLSSGLFEILLSRVMVKEVGGIPLVGIKSIALSTLDLALKTLFDFTVALVAIVLLSPLLLLITILIKLTSPGPVLYVQRRVSRGGETFNFYKFRTMCAGAEEMLPELQAYNEAEGLVFKMKNDPRVTGVGGFLRRYSLDELPQLFNVLKGEMSLVGPRPPVPSEVERYNDWHLKRLDVTPGMTGLWQVSGRSNLSFDEMVKLDLFYIENWSLTFDIKILLMTVKAVLSGTGAY